MELRRVVEASVIGRRKGGVSAYTLTLEDGTKLSAPAANVNVLDPQTEFPVVGCLCCTEAGQFMGLQPPAGAGGVQEAQYLAALKRLGAKPTQARDHYAAMCLYNLVSRDARAAGASLTPSEFKSIWAHTHDYDDFRADPYAPFRNKAKPHKMRFSLVDALARHYEVLGATRCEACVHQCLRQMMEDRGHVCVPPQLLINTTVASMRAAGHTGFAVADVEAVVAALPSHRGLVYKETVFRMEKAVAHSLVQLLRHARSFQVDTQAILAETGFKLQLNDAQMDAVDQVFNKTDLLVVTGFPGTGKSSVVEALRCVAAKLQLRLLVCAPTGKAAMRLGGDAMTIHRALDYRYDSDADHGMFAVNADHPLNCDVVVVDEVSMVDLKLFHYLLQGCPAGRVKLVLLGDRQQLPSVNYGDVLSHVASAPSVPQVRLTEIYRQGPGSSICRLAKMIAEGAVSKKGLSTSDITWIDTKGWSHSRILERVVELRAQHVHADVQVLSPSRRGVLGSGQINELVHNELFGAGAPLQVGEKIMCVKNVYVKDKDGVVDMQRSCFNGEVGVVKGVSHKSVQVTFPDKDQLGISLPLDNVSLAYCLTVHKSQGSEYGVVILVLDRFADLLLTRELLYTAVTRAKTRLVILSDDYCILKSAATPQAGRYSNLVHFIEAEMAARA